MPCLNRPPPSPARARTHIRAIEGCRRHREERGLIPGKKLLDGSYGKVRSIVATGPLIHQDPPKPQRGYAFDSSRSSLRVSLYLLDRDVLALMLKAETNLLNFSCATRADGKPHNALRVVMCIELYMC